jgi:hypothetical protein
VGKDWPDRLRLFGPEPGRDARAWCRACGHFEFARNDGWTISEAERKRIEEERTRLANLERLRVKKMVARIEETAFWRGYHEAMTDDQRGLWTAEGIPPSAQDWWELGYKPDYTAYDEDDGTITVPSMTIPFFAQADERHIANVQFRLLEKTPGGKYRFLKDLPVPLFHTDHTQRLQGRILLVEGAKKAMVAFLHMGEQFDAVVASPTKHLAWHHLPEFKECDEIVIVFDPDAIHQGQSLLAAKKLGKSRSLIASLPAKLDDMFVKYGAGAADVMRYLNQARTAVGYAN